MMRIMKMKHIHLTRIEHLSREVLQQRVDKIISISSSRITSNIFIIHAILNNRLNSHSPID